MRRFRAVLLASLAVLAVASLCLAQAVSNQVVLRFPAAMQLGGRTGKGLLIRPDLPETMPLRTSGQDLVVEPGFYPPGRELAVFESGALLGAGSTVSAGTRLRLARLPSGELVVLDCDGSPLAVRQVVAGFHHVLALLADGRVMAWGSNDRGQLGDGTTVPRAGPVLVKGITNAVAVEAGDYHSVALLADGRVVTWGWGQAGQLGNGVKGDGYYSTVPVAVKGLNDQGQLEGVVKVAAGGDTCLALLADGTLVGWGNNSYDVLLRPSESFSSSAYPVKLSMPAPPLQDIALGHGFAMALRNGYVLTWGWNANGELGDGSPAYPGDRSLLPNPVKTPDGQGYLTGVAAIAAGRLAGYALLSTGEVLMWGDGRFLPVFAPDTEGLGVLSGVAAVREGGYGITSDGKLVQFGAPRSTLVPGVGGEGHLAGVVDASGSVVTKCALLSDGRLVAWGGTAQLVEWRIGGMLGNDTWGESQHPVEVVGLGSPCGYLVGVEQVSAGYMHSLAVLSDGRVAAWGYNYAGELGGGGSGSFTQYHASLVKGLGGEGSLRASQVSAGYEYSLARLPDGTVASWGTNYFGVLGDGTQASRSVPGLVKDPADPSRPLGNVVQVAAARHYKASALAVLSDGRVVAWGANEWGTLGNGESGPGKYSALPVVVKGIGGSGELTGVVQVAVGTNHCLALLADGRVVSWGLNDKGQLGDGTTTNKAYPVLVRGPGVEPVLRDVVEVAAGGSWSLARLRDGRVVAWGNNSTGQLGTGNTVNRTTPAFVRDVNNSGQLGSAVPVVKIAAGSGHGVAVLSDGHAVAWGYNVGRAVGGDTATRTYPGYVLDPMGVTLTRVVGCAAGTGFSLLALNDGSLLGFGEYDHGQLGNMVYVYESSGFPYPPTVPVRKGWPGR